MNAVDWALANYPVDVKTIGIMGYAGDYGGDYAKGVKAAAEANGLTVAWEYIVPSPEFDVAQAVGLMVTKPVDAYFPAVGPTHMAQVAGGAFQQGLTPLSMMAAPSFNDAFVREGFALAPLFTSGSMYLMAFVAPYEAETAGHATMRATFSAMGIDSANTFLVAGWASQHHLKGVLEAANKGGDLTRAGIRRAAGSVYVDSDGMMPQRELGQNRADAESFIAVPDGTIASGVKLLAGNYVGPSAGGYDWESGPCS
jgi:ABC-type branched-subunit amino acid transport system substrate-binding protein